MSPIEWIILGAIAAAGFAACFVVDRIKKEGHQIPGSICAGCPETATVDRKPEIREQDHPDIML